MKPLLTYLTFILMALPLRAQVYEEMKTLDPDSIRRVIPTLEGTDRIDAMNKLALSWCRDLPESCIALTSRTRLLSERSDYLKGVADARLYAGNAWFYLDSIRPAVASYLEALWIYEDLGPSTEMGFCLRMLQGLNMLTGRFSESKNYGRRAALVFKSVSGFRFQTRSILTMGLACVEQEQYDSATYFFDRAMVILELHPNPIGLIATTLDHGYNLLTKFHTDLDTADLLRAVTYLTRTLELNGELTKSFKLAEAAAYHNLAEIFELIDPVTYHDSIINCRRHALAVYENYRTRAGTFMSLYWTMANTEFQSGNVNEAMALLNEGIAQGIARNNALTVQDYDSPGEMILDRMYFRKHLRFLYQLAYKISLEETDFKGALAYYTLSEKSERELQRQRNRNLVAMLEAESANEKTARQIAVLEQEKEINSLRATQSRSLVLGLGILLVVLLLMGVLVIRQNRLRSEHRSTLLEQKLLRLQMNPHFIFNALSSIHSLMNPKEVGSAAEYLGSFSRLLRTSLESSREDYIMLEDEVSSINNYLELQQLRYDGKFDYSVEVGPDINLEEAVVPPMLIQPFIENAIEHGLRHKKGKGNIQVRFRREKGQVVCEVEDDGVGREKAWETEYIEKGKHRSLATEIIRDRIAILNRRLKGKIRLDIIDKKSEAEEAMGTLVRLDLPYLLD